MCAQPTYWHIHKQLGGPGHTVAIDETVVDNAQGRPVPAQWVFGGMDLHTGGFFLELVPRHDTATLVPITQRHVLPGTPIWSDEWGGTAYINLNGLGYIHKTVNHSRHFMDPITGPAATPTT